MHKDTVLEGNAGAPATQTDSLPLRERIKPLIPLRFPGFEQHYIHGKRILAFGFEPLDCREWHSEMVNRILNAVGQRIHFPLYRMGDGEYAFAIRRAEDKLPLGRLRPRQLAKRLIMPFLGRSGYHKSGSVEYGYEVYTSAERNVLQARYVECVQKVARDGILALGLHNTEIYLRYIPAIFDWFDANGIMLHHLNYFHVYSVYVLMHGPDRHRFLKGRHVLVVTGLTDEKRHGIESGLLREGVADVQFLPISRSKAMLDVLDLSVVRKPIDLALVGAGVGSANVLEQLRPLQTVCLDVGFCLSTLANPDLRWKRPFCVPDEEFDLSRAVQFLE